MMQEVKYIMVTNWVRHWDDLESRWGNSTLFTLPMIKDGISKSQLPFEATTLFIKLDKEGKFEKSWLGITKNFKEDPNNGKPAIRFEVANLKEVTCPAPFRNYTNGWHLNKANISIGTEIELEIGTNLQPGFFKEMQNCSWEVFEQHCYHLLRTIGIHDIHALPRQSQQGKADGFFRFHTLTVIYDATLETNFLTVKEQQIENYVNQLKKEKIHFNSHSYSIKDTQRQVWLITRGAQVRHLKTEDHIKVKEIPFTKLIEVYDKRMKNEVGTDELWDILKDLN